MSAKLLDATYPTEREVVWFSYNRLIAPEDVVLTASVTITDPSGADATPSARLDGPPTVQARRVGQWLQNPVAAANYLLHCSGTMLSGRRLSIFAVLPARSS